MNEITEIETAAIHMVRENFKTLPPGLDMPSIMLFLSFYNLYFSFFNGQIDREYGHLIKEYIIKKYQNLRLEYTAWQQYFAHSASLLQNIDLYLKMYNNNPCALNADRIIEIINSINRKIFDEKIYRG